MSYTIRRISESALNFTAAQTTGAHIHMTNGSTDTDTNALGIRQKDTIGLPVRVADIVSGHSAFATNLTDFSHDHTSFWCANSLTKGIVSLLLPV